MIGVEGDEGLVGPDEPEEAKKELPHPKMRREDNKAKNKVLNILPHRARLHPGEINRTFSIIQLSANFGRFSSKFRFRQISFYEVKYNRNLPDVRFRNEASINLVGVHEPHRIGSSRGLLLQPLRA